VDLAGIARRLRALAPSAPRVRVGIWAGRVALPLLFAAFTLAVTAGFIYAFNLALLPTTAEELTFRAQRQCSAVHPEESPSWNGCVVTQRIPPSDGPVRFLVPAVAATAAGGALVLVAARFRPRPTPAPGGSD